MTTALQSREQVLRLQYMARYLPQLELTTTHYFADGMYARELVQPAGTLVIGKVHKREHFFIVTKGVLEVVVDNRTVTLRAPYVLVSKPGTKRALFALEDCVYMTVHRTKKRNLDKIEKELIEPDARALFDSANQLKVKELT